LSGEVRTWLGERAERVIETSCAWVFLGEERALKVKKPVNYGFLDFSTAEKRRWALERELAFNRATAPDIYRAVHPITREHDGALAVGGAGEVVDYALEMRRFDPDAVLSQHPDKVDGDLAEALGRTIARFHAAAEVRPEAESLAYALAVNAEHLAAFSGVLGGEETRALIGEADATFQRLRPLLEQRRSEGFIRRCHGDLHLGNILLEDGAPKLFDCIEFNDRLSEIDVLYDLAFLLMDLCFRGCGPAANRALNAYLDEAARAFPASLWDGLAALPLMLSARAAVRAHVLASQGELGEARAYRAAAAVHLAPQAPRLIAIGGLSGSGKTTLARLTAPALGPAPGAIVLRTDEIRKRLWDAGPLDRLPAAAYAPQESTRVYAAMLEAAGRCLAAKRSVILDAVFLRPEERAAAEALARDRGVRFQGVWLQAPRAVLRKRLEARVGDASDADAAVLEGQLARDPGAVSWAVRRSDDLRAVADGLVCAPD